MKLPNPDTIISWGIIAGGAFAIYAGYKAYQAGAAVVSSAKEVVTKDLNPASTENIIYSTGNTVLGAITGDKNWNLGSKIYDILHPNEGENMINKLSNNSGDF